ncbi:hypothetical protein NEOLEDRAFT_1106009 [Neolentinus lepideus HHB14362 ss-1]|uniref:SH3 domain-containing protein n=1 Tax=Neolentinus lepideus HHB14362 ss-1 TaxID=1314782 RepID=A0A165VFD8_9AGAM|nr:hypothetical protein NEOLEDRAFT_1106009 [Neolentinus lepideus HHB14362 ss-1]
MAPSLLFQRDDETSGALSSSNTPYIIAGCTVIGLIVLGLAVYLLLRFIRGRSKKLREESRGAAFLSVRGIVEDKEDKEPLPSALLGVHGETFSRNNLATENVVMPAKTIIRPDATREEILDYYSTNGTLPKPFRPFSFALNAPHIAPPSPVHDSKRGSMSSFLSVARHSFLSAGSRRMSTASTVSSLGDSGSKRKVRQIFDPVLPDELVISLEEQLTVVQSHDDGWCIVGRSSVFKPDEVEMGAVPAWVFIKPTKGLRAERPMRVSSLGVSVQLDAGPGFSSREEVISWSNF